MDLPAGVLFVANTGAAAWLADRWSRRLLPGAVGAERWLTGFLLFASLTQVCLMALGLAQVLSALSVAGTLGALVVLDALLGRRGGGLASSGGAGPEAAPPWPLAARLLVLGICAWSAWAIVGSPTLFGWDTFTYHAVAPAWWIQHESLSLVPLNYQSYYPLNAEVATLWYMLAHRVDAHANLAMVAWMGILAAACLVNARRLGHAPLLAAAALTCFLLSPDVRERLPYFTSGDLAMAGTLMAMLAYTWVPSDTNRRPLVRALLSGLAGGLALGMKPTAAPYLALAGLCWMTRRRGGTGAPWPARLGVFTAGAVLTGGFWYFRNLALTGNPLFPAALGPLEGPFTADAQRGTSLLPWLLGQWDSLGTWWRLFRELLDWPFWLGLLSVVGLASGTWAAVREKDPARRAHLRLILGCALLFLVLFPMQPFSGTVNRPRVPLIFMPRYITFAFLAGLVLLPSAWASRRRASGPPPVAANAVPDAPASDAPASDTATPAPGARLVRWTLPLLLVAVLTTLAVRTPERELETHDALWEFLGSGWDVLETLPPGTNLAVFTRDPPTHSPYYPLFGRKLQFNPIAVNQNGTPRYLLHERWRDAPQSWWWEFEVTYRMTGERLLKNLRDSGVAVVVCQDWPPRGAGRDKEPFTTRRLIADELGPERRLFRDKVTEIWDLDGRFTEGRADQPQNGKATPAPPRDPEQGADKGR